MTILTYNIALKPFIFDNCKNIFLNDSKSNYIFIDYPESQKLYKRFFTAKIKYNFLSHNDFIKLKPDKGKNDFYLGLDFYMKNIFSEKIYMSILSRYQTNQNTFSYIERQNYYKEILNSYSNFLIKNKVKKIIFYDYPHHIDSYILYIIAKHLNIKLIIISYLFLLGDYRLVFDKNLKNRFIQFKKSSKNKINKKDIIDKISKFTKSSKHIKPHYIISKNSLFYFLIKDIYRSFHRGIFSYSNFYAKNNYKLKYIDELPLREISSIFINFNQRLKIKKLEKQYLNVCTSFTLKEKYILLLPSVQPEASTLPLAGYFHDFKIIIDMLLKYLPYNWKILYKEHPLTFDYSKESNLFKTISYYNDIKHKNIKFIDHRVDTYDLIKNSQCVATSTGSAGVEASLKNKAVLNFGIAWWSNFNNIFRINNDLDLKSAIENIKNKKFIFNKKHLNKNIFDTYRKTIEFNDYNEHSYASYERKKFNNKIDFKLIENYFKDNLEI